MNLIEVILAQGSDRQKTALTFVSEPVLREPADLPSQRHRPMAHKTLRSPSAVAAAAASLAWSLSAAQTLPQVTVSGRATEPTPSLAGFTDPPAKLPLQAQSLSAERLLDSGVSQLSGLTKLDASVSDGYNAVGYWSQMKIRGFDLDNRFNLRREGLPISGETALSLANKSAVEVLKGASGMQAGTSAPAGLVNLVVKRPLDDDATQVFLAAEQPGTLQAAIDASRRFGTQREFGLRVNLDARRLDPSLRHANGLAHTAALAADWRVSSETQLDAEVEFNRQRQPSQAGFSLLGNQVPAASSVDPRLNLNNQAWSLPVEFDNVHASLRVQQRLAGAWRLKAQAATQRLHTNDRIAFPFGCTDTTGYWWADRYCPDGSFDLYDFRSENERRNTRAFELQATGSVELTGLRHDLGLGTLRSQFTSRFQQQAYNYAGTGYVDGSAITPAAPDLTDENTNRDERTTEVFIRDRVALGSQTVAWLGLRHTRLHRESVRTDGSRATNYDQSLTSPWIAVSHALNANWLLYASWGRGAESEVTPNRSRYQNAGRALPVLASRQREVGIKAGSQRIESSLAWFDITRPVWSDIGSCSAALSCERKADGTARHQGLEASADWKWSDGGLLLSATKLHARRLGAVDASLTNTTPPNVPASSIKAQWRHQITAGMQATVGLNHESSRFATPDNAYAIPAWTTLDLGLRLTQWVQGQRWIWRLAIDNATDRRAWREAPYQFSHSYLYPLAPRTVRLNLSMSL